MLSLIIPLCNHQNKYFNPYKLSKLYDMVESVIYKEGMGVFFKKICTFKQYQTNAYFQGCGNPVCVVIDRKPRRFKSICQLKTFLKVILYFPP